MNIVIIILGIVVGIVILLNPFIGLLTIVTLIPQSLLESLGDILFGLFTSATPIKIIGGLTFISTFIRHISNRNNWNFLIIPQVRFFILFLIWIFVSGFTRPGPFARENFTVFTSFAILGFIILSLIKNTRRYKLVLWAGLISNFIVCLSAILTYLGLSYSDRMQGFSYGPNEFAIGIIPFIGLAFYNIFAKNTKLLKIYSFIITAIIATALILSFSRGGILGFFAMIIIAALKAKKKIKAILLILVFFVTIINFMPKQMWERFENTKVEEHASNQDIAGTTRRYLLAKAAWEIFLDHPLFGIGVGNYYYECRLYQPVYAGRAHNTYLEIMAELGILGIFLFFGIIFTTFRGLKKIIRDNSSLTPYAWGLSMGLTGFLVAAIFLHAQHEKVFWFIIFMSASLECIRQNTADNLERDKK